MKGMGRAATVRSAVLCEVDAVPGGVSGIGRLLPLLVLAACLGTVAGSALGDAPDEVSDAVGATHGVFRVDELGSATFSVPILTAPGTAGVVPELSLNYSSQGGDGPLGLGWSIGGTSGISRCRATREAGDFIANNQPWDGNPGPVSFTTQDRFCLDGQRLVPHNPSGTACPGVANATVQQLRTEIESFQRVCAYTFVTDNGPRFFTVDDRDGSRRWYGDRRTTAGGAVGPLDEAILTATAPGYEAVIYQWAQTRFQDSTGNYIDYSYLKNPGGSSRPGEQLIRQVAFTGKLALGGQSASHAPYASVTFNYQALPHFHKGYFSGGEVWRTRRLASVTSMNGGSSLRNYRLGYELAPSGRGSPVLSSITECRSSAASAVCLEPTVFDWSPARQEFGPREDVREIQTGSMSKFEGMKLADVNGNGRQDLVWIKDGKAGDPCPTDQIHVSFNRLDASGKPYFSAPGGILCAPSELISANGENPDSSWFLLDYNGNGKDDLFLRTQAGWIGYPATGSATGIPFDTNVNLLAGISIVTGNSPDHQPQLADFNGDGLRDLIYHRGGQLYVRIMERGGIHGFRWGGERSVSTFVGGQDPCSGQESGTCSYLIEGLYRKRNYQQLNDFDGDARSDLLLRVKWTTSLGCGGGGGDPGDPPGPPQDPYSVPRDVSDPGEEISSTTCSVTRIYPLTLDTLSSSQLTFRQYGSRHWPVSSLDNASFLDINGDGLTDIVNHARQGVPPNYFLNTGTGFQGNKTIAEGSGGGTAYIRNTAHSQMVDIAGNGLADFVYPSDDATQWMMRPALPGGGFGPEVPVPGNPSTSCGSQTCLAARSYLFGDFNGDGHTELFRIQWRDTISFVHLWRVAAADSRKPRDVITRITTGLGAETELTYLPLTNKAVYTREGGSRNAPAPGRGSPVHDLLAPMYVVARARSSAPTYGNPLARSEIHYHYVGARMQAGGRGFLGFSEVHSIDGNATDHHVVTVTHYHQDFPRIGRPHTTQKFVVPQKYTPPSCFSQSGSEACFGLPDQAPPSYGGVMVHHAESAWGSSPGFTPGAVARPFEVRLDSTLEVSFDLATGVALAGVRTTFGYGANGNTTSTRVETFSGANAFPGPNANPLLTVETANTYADNTSQWRLGRLTRSIVTHSRPARPDVVRRTDFGYAMGSPHTGLLLWERIQQGDSNHRELSTYYDHDEFGNRVAVYTCSAHFSEQQCRTTDIDFQHSELMAVHRYARTTYDSLGRYVVTEHEPFRRASGSTVERVTTRVLARDPFGSPTRVRDLNGNEARSVAGMMGRGYFTWSPTIPFSNFENGDPGGRSWTTYRWCGTGTNRVPCPAGASYRVQIEADGAGTQWAFFDVLGREMMAVVSQSRNDIAGERFSGRCTAYDAQGRVARTSQPFYVPNSGPNPVFPNGGQCSVGGSIWTVTHYDALSRVVRVDLPGGGTEWIDHQGLETTYTDAMNNPPRTERRSPLGELVRTIDADGTESVHSYDAAGNLIQVARDAGRGAIITSMIYDARGRRLRLADPDAGVRRYYYNAMGELAMQMDEDDNAIRQWYDARGRLFRKNTDPGTGGLEVAYQYIYDEAPNGVGQLAKEVITGRYEAWAGVGGTAHDFQRTYTYDSMGRGIGSSTWIDGVRYDTSVQYDDLGRAWKSQDASGRWTKNQYSAVNGQLMAVCASDFADDTASCPTNSTTHLRVIQHDQRGNVIHERRRNSGNMNVYRDYDFFTGRLLSVCAGSNRSSCTIQEELYDWDLTGRLEERIKVGQYTEVFDYDGLNRMTRSRYTRVAGVQTNLVSQSMSYDRLGNVCEKSVDGQLTAFSYAGRAGCGTEGLPGHGTLSDASSPHAVSEVGNTAYHYDIRGNQVQALRLGGGATAHLHDRHIRYSLEDQAYELLRGSPSSPSERVRFWYGPDGQRYKREDASGRTLYLGNVELVFAGGTSKMRRHVAGVLVQEIQGSTVQERFVYHDHLGSVVAVSNTSGAVVEGTDFGAFGERRGYTDPRLSPQPLATTPRGYTGHEHVEAFGIVHMNGRIYEPRLGRFLQADPFVQEPNNLQNYNRYTYVWNNPLNATDPSGYLGQKERQWAGAIIMIAAVVTQQYWFAKWGAGQMAAYYAVAGGISGGVSTQSTRGALWGAFSAVVSMGVGNQVAGAGGFTRFAVNGATAGVLSSMQGGKFGHAFASAGVTALVMPGVREIDNAYARVAVSALVGGSVSAATGGKFANGAVTAAMQSAFSRVQPTEHERWDGEAGHKPGLLSRILNAVFTNRIPGELKDPVILAALRKAWLDSNPADYATRREIAFFWGYEEDGSMGVRFLPPGTRHRVRIPLTNNGMWEGLRVAGDAHIHPNPRPYDEAGVRYHYAPSSWDISGTKGRGYTGFSFVMDDTNIYGIHPGGHWTRTWTRAEIFYGK